MGKYPLNLAYFSFDESLNPVSDIYSISATSTYYSRSSSGGKFGGRAYTNQQGASISIQVSGNNEWDNFTTFETWIKQANGYFSSITLFRVEADTSNYIEAKLNYSQASGYSIIVQGKSKNVSFTFSANINSRMTSDYNYIGISLSNDTADCYVQVNPSGKGLPIPLQKTFNGSIYNLVPEGVTTVTCMVTSSYLEDYADLYVDSIRFLRDYVLFATPVTTPPFRGYSVEEFSSSSTKDGSVTEALSLSDSISTSNNTMSVTENVFMSDSFTAQHVLGTVVENISTSCEFTVIGGEYLVSVEEALSLSDSIIHQSYTGSISEILNLSSTLSSPSNRKTITEEIGISGSLTSPDYTRYPSDNIDISDSISGGIVYFHSINISDVLFNIIDLSFLPVIGFSNSIDFSIDAVGEYITNLVNSEIDLNITGSVLHGSVSELDSIVDILLQIEATSTNFSSSSLDFSISASIISGSVCISSIENFLNFVTEATHYTENPLYLEKNIDISITAVSLGGSTISIKIDDILKEKIKSDMIKIVSMYIAQDVNLSINAGMLPVSIGDNENKLLSINIDGVML